MMERIGSIQVVPKEPGEREIRRAASDFESIFIYYMLKTMRKGMVKGGLLGNTRAEAVYRSLLDERLSTVMAEGGGIGIRDMIVEWLKGKNR